MAGEGHMNAVNNVLQKNLQKQEDRRKAYKNRVGFTKLKTELEFNEISGEELENLKKKIRIEVKRNKKNNTVAFFIIAFIVLVLFYYLFSDFNIDFRMFSR